MARSVIQSVIFVASQQCRKFTWQRIPKEKPDFLRKNNILQHKWVITLKIIYDAEFGIETTSSFWELNCSLRQGTFFDAPCIAV